VGALSTNTYYLDFDDGWDLTVFPGHFVTANGERNAGPAIWLDDPLGGAIAVASSRESLIKSLEAMLDKARTMIEPLPPRTCAHCGGDILWVPVDHEAMNELGGHHVWAHFTGLASELQRWKVACALPGGEGYQATPSA
jgi:hypothetical protein